MAIIKLDGGYNALPISYKRGNPIPLDTTAVWYNFDELQAYARTGVTAYVGQMLSLVSEVKNEEGTVTGYTSTAYIISDTAGNLEPIGTAPIGDETSIEVAEDGTVSLKGVSSLVFERDVEDENGEPTGEKEEIQYQILMTKTGLTWVEPSKTTVEGLATLIDGLTQRVKAIEDDYITEGELSEAIRAIADKLGIPEDETDTLYELIAAEVLRATAAEESLSERIGVKAEPAVGEPGSEDYKEAVQASGVYAYVDGVINALVEGVDPDKIDSLNELIAWVEAHPDIVSGLDERLETVEGILDGFGGEDEPQNVKVYVDDTFAKKATTLAGYGITDTYTKKQIDENVIGTPGKPELKDGQGTVTQEKVDGTGIFVNAYSKEEVNALISQVSGGSSETAASVKLQLDTYKSTNDARSLAIEKEVWGVDATGNVNPVTGDSRIDTIEYKLDGIESGAEVNIIKTVQVNGTALTPDNNRAVNIVINSDTLADSVALKKSITDAAALAQTGVDNAATAQGTANTALQNANNNTTLIENLTKATTGGHEGDTSSLAYQIGQLQAHNTDHANEFGILKGRVDTNEETLKNKANSSDVYTKAQIGTFDTNTTTIVKMIEDEAKRADDAEKTNANAIAAIYHKEGTADATGVLAEEIARATAAEQANTNAIAALAGEGNTSTVKKNADDIATIKGQITTIQGSDKTMSMREVAREEANLVAVAAMEFMGAISELPTGLTENDKGHFYKVISDIKVGDLVEHPELQISYTLSGPGVGAGKVFANVQDSDEIDLNSLEVTLTFDPAIYSPTYPDEYSSHSETFTLNRDNKWTCDYDWTEVNVGGINPAPNKITVTVAEPE